MLLNLLEKRVSCRQFSKQPIPTDVLQYMLECGRLSASGGNEQPWKFGVITDAHQIQEIAKAASINYDQKWIESAPLLIVLCTQVFDEISSIGLNRFPSLKAKLEQWITTYIMQSIWRSIRQKFPVSIWCWQRLNMEYILLGFQVLIVKELVKS